METRGIWLMTPAAHELLKSKSKNLIQNGVWLAFFCLDNEGEWMAMLENSLSQHNLLLTRCDHKGEEPLEGLGMDSFPIFRTWKNHEIPNKIHACGSLWNNYVQQPVTVSKEDFIWIKEIKVANPVMRGVFQKPKQTLIKKGPTLKIFLSTQRLPNFICQAQTEDTNKRQCQSS